MQPSNFEPSNFQGDYPSCITTKGILVAPNAQVRRADMLHRCAEIHGVRELLATTKELLAIGCGREQHRSLPVFDDEVRLLDRQPRRRWLGWMRTTPNAVQRIRPLPLGYLSVTPEPTVRARGDLVGVHDYSTPWCRS